MKIISNIFNVPQRAWRNWTVDARFTFNDVMTTMKKTANCGGSPEITKILRKSGLPKTEIEKLLDVQCWNAAWIAAMSVTGRVWTTCFDGPYSRKLSDRMRIDALKQEQVAQEKKAAKPKRVARRKKSAPAPVVTE